MTHQLIQSQRTTSAMKKDLVEAANQIKTPLGLLALVIIVTEGLMLILIRKSSGIDFTIIVIAMVLLPFTCLGVFYGLYKGKMSEQPDVIQKIKDDVTNKPTGEKFDLFVSAPMASFSSNQEFQSSRASVSDVVRDLKNSCGFNKIFYAGAEITSFKDFEQANLSVIQDFDALYNSQYFLMFYPESLVTSALIELGWAMAFNKPIIIFIKEEREKLPFLMQNLDSAYKNIQIYRYKTSSDVHNVFNNGGVSLFEVLDNGE